MGWNIVTSKQYARQRFVLIKCKLSRSDLWQTFRLLFRNFVRRTLSVRIFLIWFWRKVINNNIFHLFSSTRFFYSISETKYDKVKSKLWTCSVIILNKTVQYNLFHKRFQYQLNTVGVTERWKTLTRKVNGY